MERLAFPGSTRLRPIIEYLMTPDQAQMALVLPGTAEEVAERTGFDLKRVKDSLDELFFKGVVFPRGDSRRRQFFRFARSIGQLPDATLATQQLDLERDHCLFDAIKMVRPDGSKKYKATVNPDKCFGCGVCACACKPGAIKMKVVRPPEHIPVEG